MRGEQKKLIAEMKIGSPERVIHGMDSDEDEEMDTPSGSKSLPLSPQFDQE